MHYLAPNFSTGQRKLPQQKDIHTTKQKKATQTAIDY